MARAVSLLTTYPPSQFSSVRLGLGLYLISHFAALIPHAKSLYGPLGMLPPELAAPFPSVLSYLRSDTALTSFLAALVVAAGSFAAGLERRCTAVVLWYGWACLVSRSPHLILPHDGYIGWLLLASALTPGDEPIRVRRGSRRFGMPSTLFWGAWVVVAAAYSVSGIFKLASPSWRTGEALRWVLESPFARLGWPREVLLSAPPWVLKGATWAALALEVLYAPLCLCRWTRCLAWTAMVGMHLGTLLLLDIASVSVAMLIVHLFVMEASWLRYLPVRGVPGQPLPSGG